MNEMRPTSEYLDEKIAALREREDWRKKARESLRWLRENDLYFLRQLMLCTQDDMERRGK